MCLLLCAFSLCCFVFVCFFPFFFLLFIQAVSPQLPHADSSDIHFSFDPPFLSPSLPASPQRLSVWFGTLTSLCCFSSFSFKAQNLAFPTSPPPFLFLITKLLASTSASPGLAPSCPVMTSHCAHGGVCVFLVLLYDFVCVFSARCFCHCRVVLLWCCVPPSLPPSSCPSKPGILGVHGDGVALPPSFLFSPSPPSLTLRASSHIHLPVLCLCLSIL